jgi:hypothetical protein
LNWSLDQLTSNKKGTVMAKKIPCEQREPIAAEARAERSILLLAQKMVPHFRKITLSKRFDILKKIGKELSEYGAYN